VSKDDGGFVFDEKATIELQLGFNDPEWFPLLQYGRLMVSSSKEFQGTELMRHAFSSVLGKMTSEQAEWDERDRRGRMLAQHAMTLRASKTVELLLKCPDVPINGIESAIGKMPRIGGMVCAVMNPETADVVSVKNLVEMFGCGIVPVIEKTIRVVPSEDGTANRFAEFIVPKGIVLLVYREQSPFEASHRMPVNSSGRIGGIIPEGLRGLSLIVYERRNLCVETNLPTISVSDRFLPVVNGHCYRVNLGGKS
jgi:hypothetical protein